MEINPEVKQLFENAMSDAQRVRQEHGTKTFEITLSAITKDIIETCPFSAEERDCIVEMLIMTGMSALGMLSPDLSDQ